MEYIPISPFQRPMTRAHLRAVDTREVQSPARPVNKWALFRELSKAQRAFGLTERALTVLQALLSFHPNDMLGGNGEMVVFPSNKAICERLHGMACSTMRRHMAQLVASGLIVRRDSPNGKRYVRQSGDDRVSFGFDLSPLPQQAEEILRAAEEVRAEEERHRRLREAVSLMRRDLASVAGFGLEMRPDLSIWDQFIDQAALTARALRRKLSIEDLDALKADLGQALDRARNLIDGVETQEMSINEGQSEHHYLNSNKDSLVFEPCQKKAGAPEVSSETPEDPPERSVPKIPLHLVVTACPAVRDFHPEDIRHWHQLYDAACNVRPSMGISAHAWEDACREMGPEQASVVLLAILQRFSDIRSPGGYLRSLTAKAADGAFSCGPMIMALLNTKRAA